MNKYLKYILISLLFLFVFDTHVSAETQTNNDIQLYTDYCYYQNSVPYSFENITDTNFDLSDTPYWFISVSRNNDTTLNYNLYSLSTSDIFFDLTGGTFYFYTEDTASTFNMKYFTCSSAIAYGDSEIVSKELQNSWTYKWSAERDFANSSWNRSAFRKWFDSDTIIDYIDFIEYLPEQEQGPQNAFIIASNFDIYNSSNSLILKKTYNQNIVPPDDNENETIEDKLDNIENTLNDNTPPDISSLQNVVGWLPPGPVDSILTLPLTMLESLSNSLSKTCEPIYLTLPFINENIELPCVNYLYEKIGIIEYVDGIGITASAFILFYYLLNLYRWVDDQIYFREEHDRDIDQWGGI